MKMKLGCLGVLALVVALATARADDTNSPAVDTNKVAGVERLFGAIKLAQSLKYQHGVINLPGGEATINLPTNICYLSPEDAETVLAKIWGNPPGQRTLGMLLPTDKKPYQPDCWAVTISSSNAGYVKDNDAGKINYDDLLKGMQKGTQEENKERSKNGYPTFELVGWAEPPHYDTNSHKLYWAVDLKVEGAAEDTLNYNIRILGRHGYLVLGAIAAIGQIQEIRGVTPQILSSVEFNTGSRYTDFDPKVDKVATYGIAALVAGGIAAKLGFFKLLLVGLLAAKKVIIIAAVAVAAWVRKIFAKRKDPNV